jgi:uncharacterized protein (TIGR02145 family)
MYWNGAAWVALNAGVNGQSLTLCNNALIWATGGLCPAVIGALNCSGATNSGSIIAGNSYEGVRTVVPYSGGNGGAYAAQNISSTGVTGLTASLAAGSLTSDSGTLTFTITGTPSSTGTAVFVISIGGQTCSFTRNVNSGFSAFHTCGSANVHNAGLSYGNMIDQEGNRYRTITIGTQTWMAENLNTSIYRNGDPIMTNLDPAAVQYSTSGAWSYNDNNAVNACPYGKLYNWYACVDSRQLCPTGWHVPSDGEWTTLSTYLGGESVAGGKMRATGDVVSGTGYWLSPNSTATNSSGFSALPGGYRFFNSFYQIPGSVGGWWSSSIANATTGWLRYLRYFESLLDRQTNGFSYSESVRCIKD